MTGSTTKKVVIRRFDRESLAGYVNPLSFQQASGVELMSLEGAAVVVPYPDIHSIAFVRDFDSGSQPERRTFNTRPKMEGLWVSLRFRNGDVMEGVLANNLVLLEPHGFTIIPPDPYSNNQRFFVPRTALHSVEVLGVVGSPLTKRKPKPAVPGQAELFEP